MEGEKPAPPQPPLVHRKRQNPRGQSFKYGMFCSDRGMGRKRPRSTSLYYPYAAPNPNDDAAEDLNPEGLGIARKTLVITTKFSATARKPNACSAKIPLTPLAYFVPPLSLHTRYDHPHFQCPSPKCQPLYNPMQSPRHFSFPNPTESSRFLMSVTNSVRPNTLNHQISFCIATLYIISYKY